MNVPDSCTSMVGGDAQVLLELVLELQADLRREGHVGAVDDRAARSWILGELLEPELSQALFEQGAPASGSNAGQALALTARTG